MTGAVVMQDGLDYQQARKVWNADIDQRALRAIMLWLQSFRLTIRRRVQT
jgi:hypothetical protein